MDLICFQYDRSFVLEALRHGDMDYLEDVSEAPEADLFRPHPAAGHPTPGGNLSHTVEKGRSAGLDSPVQRTHSQAGVHVTNRIPA